jgi:hypothetical protein
LGAAGEGEALAARAALTAISMWVGTAEHTHGSPPGASA